MGFVSRRLCWSSWQAMGRGAGCCFSYCMIEISWVNGLLCEQAGVWGGGNLLEKAEDVDRHEIMDYFRRGVCWAGWSGWKK